jgi:hypothetical protein
MIDKGGTSKSSRGAKRHLEESLTSGRISRFEANVIERFFAATPSPEWPASGLQKRMQASGGQQKATGFKADPERKS